MFDTFFYFLSRQHHLGPIFKTEINSKYTRIIHNIAVAVFVLTTWNNILLLLLLFLLMLLTFLLSLLPSLMLS